MSTAGPSQGAKAPSGGSTLHAVKSVGASLLHPRDVLLGSQAGSVQLPVCDHYSGVEARMRKSLQLQAEMTQEFGTCVFDVTLDCEDGAPVGGEAEHAARVAQAESQLEEVRALERLGLLRRRVCRNSQRKRCTMFPVVAWWI